MQSEKKYSSLLISKAAAPVPVSLYSMYVMSLMWSIPFRPMQIMKTWVLPVDGSMYRIVLEKDTLDIYANGRRAETAGEFTDEGTETHFTIANTPAFVRAESTGNRRKGIVHKLFVHDSEVPEYLEHVVEDDK